MPVIDQVTNPLDEQLWLALLNINKPTAESLIQQGAKDFVVAEGVDAGISSLWLAFERKYYEIVDALLDRGATDSVPLYGVLKGISTLWLALNKEQFEIAEALAQRGAKDSVMEAAGPFKGISVAFLAVEKGRFNVLRSLLQHDLTGRNREILQALCAFSDEVSECLYNLLIDGVEDPIFEPLKEYICPISKCLILNPVTISDGYTYNRENIQRHINQSAESTLSPLTREPIPQKLPNMSIIAATRIKSLITEVGAELTQRFAERDTPSRARTASIGLD